MSDTDIIRFRIPADIKKVFFSQCERQGFPASLVLRKIIEEHISQNKQLDIFKGVKNDNRRN